MKRVCQSLAILALVCQTLATGGCATESRMDALIARMGEAHRTLLEAPEANGQTVKRSHGQTATTTEEP